MKTTVLILCLTLLTTNSLAQSTKRKSNKSNITNLNLFAIPEENWKPLSKTNHTDYFYNSRTIQRTDKGHVKLWVLGRINQNKKQESIGRRVKFLKKHEISTEGYEAYFEFQTFYECDCKARRLQTLSNIDYDESGTVLNSSETEIPNWFDIPPNTMGESIFKIACL